MTTSAGTKANLTSNSIGGVSRRQLLLGCGAFATLLYIALDTVAALRHPGYSYLDQTISELSAIGAPTRSLWIPFGVVYSLLVIAGAVGVWLSAGRSRALRCVAVLQAALGVLGLIAWPFAPMHRREVLAAGGGNFSDDMHLILAMFDTLIFFSCIILGSGVFGKRFRIYSLVTVAVLLIFGAFTGANASRVGADESTPLLGVAERITVFGSMAWLSMLAIGLMPARDRDKRP